MVPKFRVSNSGVSVPASLATLKIAIQERSAAWYLQQVTVGLSLWLEESLAPLQVSRVPDAPLPQPAHQAPVPVTGLWTKPRNCSKLKTDSSPLPPRRLCLLQGTHIPLLGQTGSPSLPGPPSPPHSFLCPRPSTRITFQIPEALTIKSILLHPEIEQGGTQSPQGHPSATQNWRTLRPLLKILP